MDIITSLRTEHQRIVVIRSMVDSTNMSCLQDIKAKTKMYEKYYSENVSKTEETPNTINELDSAIDLLEKIEEKRL